MKTITGYHSNENQTPCHAQPGNCPLGLNASDHASTPAEARESYLAAIAAENSLMPSASNENNIDTRTPRERLLSNPLHMSKMGTVHSRDDIRAAGSKRRGELLRTMLQEVANSDDQGGNDDIAAYARDYLYMVDDNPHMVNDLEHNRLMFPEPVTRAVEERLAIARKDGHNPGSRWHNMFKNHAAKEFVIKAKAANEAEIVDNWRQGDAESRKQQMLEAEDFPSFYRAVVTENGREAGKMMTKLLGRGDVIKGTKKPHHLAGDEGAAAIANNLPFNSLASLWARNSQLSMGHQLGGGELRVPKEIRSEVIAVMEKVASEPAPTAKEKRVKALFKDILKGT